MSGNIYNFRRDRLSESIAAVLESPDVASRMWDDFYKRNQTRFFRDRHYLDREFPGLFNGPVNVLEVGCGVGNTVYPLLETNAEAFVYACDFAESAIQLLREHPLFQCGRVKAFKADITKDNLTHWVPPESIDFVTMVFVLSALEPDAMKLAVRNVAQTLKPGGVIYLRDYGEGDWAESRFSNARHLRRLGENYYVRGDGTRAFYFSKEVLRELFESVGFTCRDLSYVEKVVENRARGIIMDRRWVQATFQIQNAVCGHVPSAPKPATPVSVPREAPPPGATPPVTNLPAASSPIPHAAHGARDGLPTACELREMHGGLCGHGGPAPVPPGAAGPGAVSQLGVHSVAGPARGEAQQGGAGAGRGTLSSQAGRSGGPREAGGALPTSGRLACGGERRIESWQNSGGVSQNSGGSRQSSGAVLQNSGAVSQNSGGVSQNSGGSGQNSGGVSPERSGSASQARELPAEGGSPGVTPPLPRVSHGAESQGGPGGGCTPVSEQSAPAGDTSACVWEGGPGPCTGCAPGRGSARDRAGEGVDNGQTTDARGGSSCGPPWDTCEDLGTGQASRQGTRECGASTAAAGSGAEEDDARCMRTRHEWEDDGEGAWDEMGLAALFGGGPEGLVREEVAVSGLGSIGMQLVSGEHRHMLPQTGLMRWTAAPAFAELLVACPALLQGKTVVELGAGASPVVSLAALRHARRVVATDGHVAALDLLSQNLSANSTRVIIERARVQRLIWGDGRDVAQVRALVCGGYDVVMGVDVVYLGEALPALMRTIYDLLNPPLAYAILCHLPRRVSETTICRLAKQIGLLRKPMPEQLAETLETFPLLAKNLHGLSLLFFERMSRAG